MSKGSRIVQVRLPEELLAQVTAELAMRNENTREAPWTMSDFVRQALKQTVAKRRRSRASRKPARVPLGEEIVTLG